MYVGDSRKICRYVIVGRRLVGFCRYVVGR